MGKAFSNFGIDLFAQLNVNNVEQHCRHMSWLSSMVQQRSDSNEHLPLLVLPVHTSSSDEVFMFITIMLLIINNGLLIIKMTTDRVRWTRITRQRSSMMLVWWRWVFRISTKSIVRRLGCSRHDFHISEQKKMKGWPQRCHKSRSKPAESRRKFNRWWRCCETKADSVEQTV